MAVYTIHRYYQEVYVEEHRVTADSESQAIQDSCYTDPVATWTEESERVSVDIVAVEEGEHHGT